MLEPTRGERIAALNYNPADHRQETVTACNLCRRDRFCTLAWQDRYAFDTRCNVCLHCGLAFLSPRLTAAEYAEFYKSVYRPLVSAYHGRRIDAVTVQDDQAGYARELLAFLEPHLRSRPVRRVMDIGGSTGVIAEAVSRLLGCTGVVLDPSPEELAVAREKGLETVCALLEDYDPTRHGTSDLVLLCQTIDHVLDARGALEKARDMLSDGGMLFVDIVDFRTAYLRNGSVEEAVKIDHPYYLTCATMEACLAVTGFEVRAMTFAPDHLHVGYLCTKCRPVEVSQAVRTDVREMLKEIRAVQSMRK